MRHQFFNNESIELSSSSEIGNIIQEGEVIFKKNPTVGLSEVSKLLKKRRKKGDHKQKKRRPKETQFS